MKTERSKPLLNLQNLESISRGDSERMLKYLNQFQQLILDRLEQLKLALAFSPIPFKLPLLSEFECVLLYGF